MRKSLVTGIKFFFVYTLFCFFENFFFFFFFFGGEVIRWKLDGNLFFFFFFFWETDGNQITLYTFCVQEKRKKDYFLVVASYKVPFILLFDRLKICIHNFILQSLPLFRIEIFFFFLRSIQNRDKSSWSVTHNHKTSNPCKSILKFLTFSSDHSRWAGYVSLGQHRNGTWDELNTRNLLLNKKWKEKKE